MIKTVEKRGHLLDKIALVFQDRVKVAIGAELFLRAYMKINFNCVIDAVLPGISFSRFLNDLEFEIFRNITAVVIRQVVGRVIHHGERDLEAVILGELAVVSVFIRQCRQSE